MAFSSAELKAAHRAGKSLAMYRREQRASSDNMADSGEFGYVRSVLPNIAGAALTSGTAYWVYVGRTHRQVTVNRVRGFVTTVAAGAQTAEIAVASSDAAPNGAAVTLTVLQAASLGDDMTALGVKGNASDLGLVVPESTHLWLGVRTAMASTQPVFYGLTGDFGYGEVLTTAAAGVLATGSTYTGALITAAVTFQAPGLFAVLGA